MNIVRTRVRLSPEEAFAATNAGLLEIVRKVSRGRDIDHGGRSLRPMRVRIADAIHGKMAEFAGARCLGRAWTPGGADISTGDVDDRVEIRGTEHEHGHLLLYERDREIAHREFVLMVGNYPDFRLAGWIVGSEGMLDRFWHDDADPPCWWVSQSALRVPT